MIAQPAENLALEVRGLEFRYRSGGGFALSLANLAIRPGEQVLLRGGSGTGKSTLLQVIAGLVDPSGGTVRVAGTDVHALRGAARDRFRGTHVGMIFQTFNLLQGFSALENVLAALMFSELPRNEHRQHAVSLLRTLNVPNPDSPVETMSVGQQQRVAVARAVACRPTLVLADEPTASLDPENASAAIELIQTTCAQNGAALLCTSHDPAMTSRFSSVESLGALGPAPDRGAVGAGA